MKGVRSDHLLRTHPGPFRALWRGDKTAEVRKNDRDFQVNDVLEMFEFDPNQGKWIDPHRRIYATVSHMLYGPAYGIQEGYVLLSFRAIRREITSRRRA